MNPPDEWVAFVEPEPNKIYKCTTCFDYGGLFNLTGPLDHNGMPQSQICWQCPGFYSDI